MPPAVGGGDNGAGQTAGADTTSALTRAGGVAVRDGVHGGGGEGAVGDAGCGSGAGAAVGERRVLDRGPEAGARGHRAGARRAGGARGGAVRHRVPRARRAGDVRVADKLRAARGPGAGRGGAQACGA